MPLQTTSAIKKAKLGKGSAAVSKAAMASCKPSNGKRPVHDTVVVAFPAVACLGAYTGCTCKVPPQLEDVVLGYLVMFRSLSMCHVPKRLPAATPAGAGSSKGTKAAAGPGSADKRSAEKVSSGQQGRAEKAAGAIKAKAKVRL